MKPRGRPTKTWWGWYQTGHEKIRSFLGEYTVSEEMKKDKRSK